MNRVFKHTPTGDLYAVTGGDLAHHVGLDGGRFYNLQPVMRLVDEKTREPVAVPAQEEEGYRLLVESFAFTLTVSQAELDAQFVELPQWLDAQNSTIEEVLAHYRAERCNFDNLAWCAMQGLTSATNMGDGLTRCVLYVLAKHVSELEAAKRTAGAAPA